MCLKQCTGVTKKGTRCLKKVSNGEFCHYHIGQKGATSPSRGPPLPLKYSVSNLPQRRNVSTLPQKYNISLPLRFPKVEPSLKPGYIYVYTLAALLSKTQGGGFLKTRNLLTNAKHKDKWVDFNAKRLDVMLVKVGMTTQTVSKRILQWESKCNHKIECLYPNSHKFQSSSFLQRFERLSLNGRHKAPEFATFQDDAKGFFVPRDVMRAETEIHHLLKLKFGRGDVYCTGCVAKLQEETKAKEKPFSLRTLFNKKEFIESDYNVHVEWFPIPKKQMMEVYRIIDSVCLKYAP